MGQTLRLRTEGAKTVLLRVARDGRKAMVKLLVKGGPIIEAKDREGQTALLQAAREGRSAMAKLLVEKGVNVEARDAKGCTALGRAALRGRRAISLQVSTPCIFSGVSIGQNQIYTDIYILYILYEYLCARVGAKLHVAHQQGDSGGLLQ
jgi:ankyrin repeat protein